MVYYNFDPWKAFADKQQISITLCPNIFSNASKALTKYQIMVLWGGHHAYFGAQDAIILFYISGTE